MRKVIVCVLAVVFTAGAYLVHAQAPGVAPNGQIRCYTNEMDDHLHAKHPELQTREEFEVWMAEQLQHREEHPELYRVNATRIIPTVVHVIFSNAAENISDAQVQSQIDILNEDFQRLNADTTNTPAAFLPVAVDSDLEFCLASIDPGGNPTNGINRVSLAGSPFTTGFIDNTIKPSTIWDPNNYFNIWIVNITGGVLGYAQFPDGSGLAGMPGVGGAANTDGVVLLTSSVGWPPFNTAPGPYNRGRTATHEVGHWLGLRHIWGDGGCGVDDFCADTPESDDSNFGCPTTHVSCGTTDMVQNYMDYTDDLCMNIFTADQKARMDVVMANSPRRGSLLASTVCTLSPEITFVTANTAMTENSSSGATACRGFQDIDLVLRIGGPPVGAATVNLTVVGGTAIQGVDYDIIIGTVVFPSGVTGNQTCRIRIYDDADLEALETVTFGFTITGTTDAFAGAQNQHQVDITDNDLTPANSGTAVLFSEDFESGGAAGWAVNAIGGQSQWAIAGANAPVTGTRSSYVSRNAGTNNNYRGNQNAASNLTTPQIDATGVFNLSLTFNHFVGGEANFDYGRLGYSLDGITYFLVPGTPNFDNIGTTTSFTTPLPAACENTTFYLGFLWVNDDNVTNQPGWTIDDIVVTGSAPVQVETDLNANRTAYLGPNSTVYWYDQSSGEVLLRIENPSAHDYGCTDVTIDRSGTGATLFMDGSMNYACTDKTYLVTPTNNNTGGTYDIRLYYTDAEISGWETATGQPRGSINVVKSGGAISNVTPAMPLANGNTNYYGINPNRGTYSTNDYWVEARFTTGFSGFAAGIENTNPVPVEFVSLDAEWQDADAYLTWEVGSFSNLRIFQIERRSDNGEFIPVGQALPNTSQGHGGVYTFYDQNAAQVPAGQLYYRIRALDFDGSITLSEVRILSPGHELQVSAHPNPFNQDLSLRLQMAEAGPVRVQIRNPLGQDLGEVIFEAQAGVNQLPLPAAELGPAGVYLIEVQVDGKRRVLKVLRTE